MHSIDNNNAIKCVFLINTVLLNFLLIKESQFPKKIFFVFFNIDNNKKCFLSIQSAHYNDFWRALRHWTLEFYIQRNKIWMYNVILNSNITDFNEQINAA